MAIKVTVMPLDIDPDSKPLVQILEKEEFTIGRLPSNDIVLNRPEISGIHARLRLESSYGSDQGKLYITDLGSSNGTMVEKNPLRARVEVAMQPNERIFIGNYVIKPAFHQSELTESSSVEKEKDSSGSSAIRRNYLSDALKEYEEGKENLDRSKEIEERIDRFAEERAVANGVSPSSSFLSSMMDKANPLDEGESNLGLNAMFGHEKKEVEALSPFGSGSFKNIDEESDMNNEETFESKKNDFAVSQSSNENGFDRAASTQEQNMTRELARNFRIPTKDEVAETIPEPVTQQVTKPLAEPEVQEEPTKESIEAKVADSTESEVTDAKPIQVSKENVQDNLSIKVKVDGSDVRSFDFNAAAYTPVAGRVLHKGSPLMGVKVKLENFGEIETASDGTFVFPKVLEGTEYKVSLEKAKFELQPSEFRGISGLNNKDIECIATQLFSISGVINHNGKPLGGVVVDGGVLGKTTTADDGSYIFKNVPEGKEYNLTLSKDGYAFAK